MGWSSERLCGSIKEFFTRKFEWENEKTKYTILDSSLVRFHTWYAAMKITDKNTGKHEVIAAVVLVQMHPRSYYNISYKEMTEESGPCNQECPKKILELLTPTTNKYALAWRQACWNNINAKPTGLKTGHYIYFDKPIEFTDGFKTDWLLISNARRRWFKSHRGDLYKLTTRQLKNRNFHTIDLNKVETENLPMLIGTHSALDREIGRRLNKHDYAYE